MKQEFFEYEWHVKRDPALFSVDESFYDDSPKKSHPILLYLGCASRRENAENLTRSELSRSVSLHKKCLRNMDALFVGTIELPDQMMYYYYSPSKKELAVMERATANERLLFCTVGYADEPEWTTYRELLYPDAAKRFTVRNGKNIELIARRGDGIEQVRRLTLHMFFLAEHLAIQFAEEARLSGFAVGDSEFMPEYDLAYGIKIHRQCTLIKHDVDRTTTKAIRIAEGYGGELRYWDCPIVPKKSPLK